MGGQRLFFRATTSSGDSYAIVVYIDGLSVPGQGALAGSTSHAIVVDVDALNVPGQAYWPGPRTKRAPAGRENVTFMLRLDRDIVYTVLLWS